MLVRSPAVDPDLPDTSDLDFLAFADADDVYPERLALPGRAPEHDRPIDVTWVPSRWLEGPEELAARGLIAHRLVTSDLVWWRDDRIAEQCRSVANALYAPRIHERRVAGFMQMGFLTVREIGVTRDFPALALFWLHMAYAACAAAALDGARRLCPNVFTRPLDYLPELEERVAPGLHTRWIRDLCLDADPVRLVSAVRRVHAALISRFPEPAWPAAMADSTRREYRYWSRAEELEWRIRAAEEMVRRGRAPAAVYYLRFCAYALARVPMVHARAGEGRDVSYLRPEGAVRPELERLCPEVLGDLTLALAGEESPAPDRVQHALAALLEFRERTREHLRRCGLSTAGLDHPWVPYRRRERPDQGGTRCQT